MQLQQTSHAFRLMCKGFSHIGELCAGCLPVNMLEAQQGGGMAVEGRPSLHANPIQALEASPAGGNTTVI